jgi:NAD(P)-dependent dehydrogenase (short-subunit alcohol dehydrogenase family)
VHVVLRVASSVGSLRLGKPEAIAKAVAYLASADASFVSGIELFVDGGKAQV